MHGCKMPKVDGRSASSRAHPLLGFTWMDSVIELQRQTHEEVERLEKALAIILSQSTSQVR